MTVKVNTNGQARKSLAEQIDRLDAMLDGLAEGINDTVVAAVKEAVGAAVKAVLREVLSSPELLARQVVAVPATTQPAAKPKVSWKQRWAAVCKATTAKLDAARQWCGRRLSQLHNWAGGLLRQVRVLTCFKYQLLTALGVGLAAGVAAYFAGPWLAAAAGATGGFATTLAVQVVMALRRLMTQMTASAL